GANPAATARPVDPTDCVIPRSPVLKEIGETITLVAPALGRTRRSPCVGSAVAGTTPQRWPPWPRGGSSRVRQENATSSGTFIGGSRSRLTLCNQPAQTQRGRGPGGHR